MIPWKGPSFGAKRFRVVGLGSGCLRTFLMVLREWSNSRAICRMDLPSRLRPPNGAVIVHRKHFLASVRVSDSMQERSLYRRRLRWVIFRRSHCPEVGQS